MRHFVVPTRREGFTMGNQRKKIASYRDLTYNEIDSMHSIKALEPDVG
ncbi:MULTISPECIES: hypothetical protein [Pseudomonas]|nr:hypothetical protein [Pseudomonas mosselii]